MDLEKQKQEFMAALREVIDAAKPTIDSMNQFEEWNSPLEVVRNIKAMINLGRLVGVAVMEAKDIVGPILLEEVSDDEISTWLCATLDSLIPLPIYLEWLDNIIIESIVDHGLAWARKKFSAKDNDLVAAVLAAGQEVRRNRATA